MAPLRVLVVDDNQANLKLVAFVLLRRGFEVRTARNADETLQALAAGLPQLVLMDLQLPGVDGLALTRRLKADPATRSLVIVALTAFAMRGDEEKALAAGCDGYLTKPIDTRTFADRVAAFLEVRA